jgi:small subunit ribosomal protein S1
VKRFNHPSDFTKVGDVLDVVILGVDKETRKLSLGHKQIEEDPWNTFETVFPIGSLHDGVMLRKEEKGGIIQLQYGLEAFAPTRHLRKQDEKTIAVDETNKFMILEFDRNEKRIMVSHTKVWEHEMEEEKEVARKEANTEADNTKKAVKNLQTKVEKATLGDIGALADLKKKMEGNNE